MSEVLNLYAILPATRALGPYCRFALWVQGCDRRCPGCISPDSRPRDGGNKIEVGKIAQAIQSSAEVEGLTISGGEPFLQAGQLADLLSRVRAYRDIGVILYTGYTFEEIRLKITKGNQDFARLLNHCDVLIDGAYIEQLNDGAALRGSSNQQAIYLTDRYREALSPLFGQTGRQVEFHLLGDVIFMAGIPGKEMNSLWQKAKKIEEGN